MHSRRQRSPNWATRHRASATSGRSGLGEAVFQPERLGGAVRGKALAPERDCSKAVILVDATAVADSPAVHVIDCLDLLAHEYGRVFIGRLRAAVGTRQILQHECRRLPRQHLSSLSKQPTITAATFANNALGILTATVDGGEPQPVTLGFLRGDTYLYGLIEALGEVVHPGWADLVHAYRCDDITLFDMYIGLLKQTREIMILIAHADATASSVGNPPLLSGGVSQPGVTLYLRDAWTPIRAVLNDNVIIPALDEFATADRAVLAAAAGISGMWAKLGVGGELIEGDRLYLHVTEPVR